MALVHADFVRETTTTTGTGTLTLAGATTGCRTFVSTIGANNTCYYAIETSAGQFESGIGTVGSSPATLARTTFIASTTGSVLNLPAGTHTVYCTFSSSATTGFATAAQGGKADSALQPAALATGVATFLATPSSANFAAALTDETGTGALVFANSPSLVTPILGIPTSGTLTNCTGYPREATVREVWIDAAAMAPRTTNGASISKRESGTNKVNSDVLVFDGSISQGANFKISFPTAWAIGTVKFKAYWDIDSGASSGTGVTWSFSAYAESDNDSIDTAFPTATTVDDTVLAVGKVHVSAATSPITIGGSPALGDIIWFEVARVTSAANDNTSQSALLLGVKLQYTESTTAPGAW